MQRSHVTPDLIPLATLPVGVRASQQATGASPTDKRPKDWFRIENKTTEQADVYIYDEIGYWGTNAADFADTLRELDVKTINLHLNSPGGEVFDGVAIYNTLVNHKASVTVYVDGLAASAASFIAQAGDEVVMGNGATMMIHDASGLAWGNASEMHKTADILDGLSQTIAGLYANRAGGSPDMWRGMMKAETWYNAAEAVEAGLADKVSVSTIEEPAENRWNLSVFNYAGRGEAPSPQLTKQSILNRVTKEKPVVPIVKNEDGVTEPVEEPVVEVEDEDEDVEEEPTVVPETPVAPENKGVFSVLVNGVATSDPRAVQTHINTLEGFVAENKASARTNFVNKLAEDGKIVASQKDGLQSLVSDLNDDQYAKWCATWDAAQPLPLLARHGVQDTTASAADKAKADRIETLRGIVQHHRQGGMKDAELETKDSYIELMRLTENAG